MGLAPYGSPIYADIIRGNLIDIKPDGSFRLDLKFFDYCTGLTMTNAKFDALFGAPVRAEEAPLTQLHMDLAASIQHVTEDVVLKLCRSLLSETGERNLCLAGGVALNCVANGKIKEAGIFENIWVQPAASCWRRRWRSRCSPCRLVHKIGQPAPRQKRRSNERGLFRPSQ